MAFQHGARTCSIDYAGNAALHIQAHIGVQRCAHCRGLFTKHSFSVLLNGADQRRIACQWGHGIGQQQALDVNTHGIFTGITVLGVEVCCGFGDHCADGRFHLGGILFRDHAAVQLERNLAGDHIGVGAAFDAANVHIRVLDAGHLGQHLLVFDVFSVQAVHDGYGGLQRIHPGVGDSGVGHLSVYRHFHLQAAVVRGDHFVAKACRHHQVGLGQTLLQQPAGAQQSAKLFVVGEVQLYRALGGLGYGFQCAYGKGKGGKVALADRCCAAKHLAVFNLGAVGGFAPAFARWHHIAVGVQCNGFAAIAGRAVGAAHDQVGDGLHAVVLHLLHRYYVFFSVKTKGFNQVCRAFCVGGVVAWGGIGRHLHQCLQKLHLLVKVLVNPCIQRGVGGLAVLGHSCCLLLLVVYLALNCVSNRLNASTASCMSSLVVDSSGLWLMPLFRPRVNNMAWGMISCSFMASWPAPLGMR